MIDGGRKKMASVVQAMRQLGAVSGGLFDGHPVEARPLGSGSFATVYSIHTRQTIGAVTAEAESSQQKCVAAKVPQNIHARQTLATEAALLLAVQGHPCVVRFQGIFCCDGLIVADGVEPIGRGCMLVMDLYPGGDVANRIRKQGPYREAAALRVQWCLLHALRRGSPRYQSGKRADQGRWQCGAL
jgi:serine/threonine protein kinase